MATKIRVTLVGAGAMGRGIASVLRKSRDMELVAIADVDPDALTRVRPLLSANALITTEPTRVLEKKTDVMIDASSSVFESALLIGQALDRKIHVILMNSGVDQVFGRLLAKRAEANGVILTSDAGDQHGVLSRLVDEVRRMGFQVVLAGNNKGFLDRYANPKTIVDEAAKRRISVTQCTSFTDGTKLAIEMALVANGVGLGLLQRGMIGLRVANVDQAVSAFDLERARELGGVVDYVLGSTPGGSVFVIGYSAEEDDRSYLAYYKMGNGPYYLFLRPYHLCHFETPWAIRQVVEYRKPILVQKRRILEVGCRAKIDLQAGTQLDGVGGYHLYGTLEEPGNLPIGISQNTILLGPKKRDDPVTWDDVEFPTNDRCLALWKEQEALEA